MKRYTFLKCLLWKNSSSEKVSAMKVRSFAKVASLKKQFFRKGRWCRILLCRKLSFFRKVAVLKKDLLWRSTITENVAILKTLDVAQKYLLRKTTSSIDILVLNTGTSLLWIISSTKKVAALRSIYL